MSFEILAVVVGAFVSMLSAVAIYALKESLEHRHKREKDKTLEEVKRRITEVGFNIAGISMVHKIDHAPEPKFQLTNELIREIEKEIAKRASGKVGASHEEIKAEIDRRMEDVRERISKIEDRFPDRETIDKIASINDALFAERIEQLSYRLDSIEKRSLSKWDVAITVSLVVAGIFAVVGATYAALSTFGVVA